MTKNDRIKIAEDINKYLKPEPLIKINTKTTDAALIASITSVIENYDDKGQLPQKTIDALCDMELDVPANIKPLTKKAVAVTKQKKKDGPKKQSVKSIIYSAWKAGETDVKKLIKLSNGTISEKSVSWYISRWNNGYEIPSR